jgi:glycosyltransferase involved in cell wall biosynthesis
MSESNGTKPQAEAIEETAKISKIAFVGDYVPRQCGIATFTADVLRSVTSAYPNTSAFVLPVNEDGRGYQYPSEVRFEIAEQDIASYKRAADFLNINNVDVVCLQHEYGLYGGTAGSHLLALLRDLKMPIVSTLHTILEKPQLEQKYVMQQIVQLSTRLIAMTARSIVLLRDVYQAPPEKIDLIPHGIPDMQFIDPNFYKDEFSVEGRLVLLTFGLLAPNKGIEYVLNALPEIVAEYPDIVYIVLGATHPNLLQQQGESYRLSLERLAKTNGVQKNVIFYNRFVDIDELKRFIGAADLYITPYLNEAQAVSGTLAYSFGAGKAVISTPYWHAAELLAEERGVIVPFQDSKAIAREVLSLLKDDVRRHARRKTAYKLSREWIWSNTARLYMASFEKARQAPAAVSHRRYTMRTLDQEPSMLPAIRLDHLFRMSDSTGMFQHARFTVPDFAHGYCTDDNTRALILAVHLEELQGESFRLRSLAGVYAAFVHHAFDANTGHFHNFMSFDRRWLDDVGSEDCHGHALWALGTCVGRSQDTALQMLAAQLFDQALPAANDFVAPRGWALALMGIHEYFRRLSGDRLVNQIRETLANRLLDLLKANGKPDWNWFEDTLTYANADLPHALILSGRWLGRSDLLDAGLATLRWLIDSEFTKGYFRPVGSDGFYKRGEKRAEYIQQPIEAYTMISACLEAYRTTSDSFWRDQAARTFEWFLGRNDLGLPLYDSVTGGCRDGLKVDRLNPNEGAESTLAFLLALVEIQVTENVVATFKRPMLT